MSAHRKPAFDPKTAEVFTTRQVAEACRVGYMTAARWGRSGVIPFYNLPMPGLNGPVRRFRRKDLLDFMRASGLPMDLVE